MNLEDRSPFRSHTPSDDHTPSGGHTPYNSDSDEFYEALEIQESDAWEASVASEELEPAYDGEIEFGTKGETGLELGQDRIGGLKQCDDLVLVATGEPLYIPITQVSPCILINAHWSSLKDTLTRALHIHCTNNSIAGFRTTPPCSGPHPHDRGHDVGTADRPVEIGNI